jgi:[acyl-carrier-protein] S-malonyltransferase
MLALLFPGQGSQRPGMGLPWRDHPSWEVVGALSNAVGRDLAPLLLDAEADELQATRNSQLATFTLCLVVLDALRRSDLKEHLEAEPVVVAGHSLGEYTGLVASGALEPAEGAKLVWARGEAMQTAAGQNPGTMAAVLGLDMDDVVAACHEIEGAWVANDNSPGQVVVAGTFDGVGKAGAAALERGAKRVVPLRVGGAFHTPLMKPAQGPLDAALRTVTFASAGWPVVANVDAAPHQNGFGLLLSAQLCSLVRWRDSLVTLASLGARTFVELGPGTELSGMVKRTLPGVARANVAQPDDLGALAARMASPSS